MSSDSLRAPASRARPTSSVTPQPSPRAIVDHVQQALRALSSEIDHLDALAAERYGLNRTDLHCLELLGRAGTITPTALAAALGFTTGGVTTVIDRLDQAGYARRRPDPIDRRRLVVEATDLLASRDEEIFGRLIASTTALISSYSDSQLRTIFDFLDRAHATIAAHGESLHVRTPPPPRPKPPPRVTSGVQGSLEHEPRQRRASAERPRSR